MNPLESKKTERVCVIGAGIAGVSAAIRLLEKGHQVTVYERNNYIGGKCYIQELDFNGETLSIDMGAAVVAVSYHYLIRFARILGTRTSNANPYKIINSIGEISTMRNHFLPREMIFRLLPQFIRYLRHVRHFYKNHVSKTGYRDNIANAYLVPFSQYCQQHQMEDILNWFDFPLAAWGYGDPKEMPTWYVFGEIDFMGMLGLFITILFGRSKFVKGLSDGYGNLVRNIAEHNNLQVRTSAEVLSIDRQPNGVIIETQQKTESFDRVIISSPKGVNLLSNPTKDETAFLDKVKYRPYATVLCHVDRPIATKLIVKDNLEKENAIRMVAAPHQNSPFVVCYLCISEKVSEDAVKNFVTNDLASLGIGLVDIHHVRLWKDYFPHFSSYDGYKHLLAAQGNNRTIYVGALNKFEFIESVVSTSINLVDQHFTDRIPPTKESFTSLRNIIYMLFK